MENETIYVLNFSNEYDTATVCLNRHILQIICFEAAGKTIRLITTSNRLQIGSMSLSNSTVSWMSVISI